MIAADRRECTVGDIAAPVRNALVGGPFGSDLVTADYVPTGVPVIRGQNLDVGKYVGGDFVFVSDAKAQKLSANLARPGDLVFTQRGNTVLTGGQVAIVPPEPFDRYLVSQSQMKLTPDTNRVDPQYLYYVFTSRGHKDYLRQNAIVTGVPHTNLGLLRDYRLSLPPLLEQRAIAKILGTLDDKIELNRRINETLEGIARALFKSWFVDFDPVRAKAEGREPEGMDAETAALFPDSLVGSRIGEIPAGWDVKSLGEVCSQAIGGDWGQEAAFEGSVEVTCLRGVDLEHLRRDGFAREAPSRWIKATSLAKRSLDECDVLIAGSGAGPTGRPLWMCDEVIAAYDLPVIYSNFCKRIRCSSTAMALYIDRCLHEMRESGEIWAHVNGTSLPNLNMPGLLGSKIVVVPPLPTLTKYLEIMRPIVGRLYTRESRTLGAIRDALLPKLLSGEMRVPESSPHPLPPLPSEGEGDEDGLSRLGAEEWNEVMGNPPFSLPREKGRG